MNLGIYYAYWEKEWGGDFLPYISKVKRLGFDILEVACGDLQNSKEDYCLALRREAEACGIRLTGGYGPRPEHDLASPSLAAVKNTFEFYKDIFKKMELAGIKSFGGALYSYWPASDAAARDKVADLSRSISNMQILADMALEHGITLNMEALNRFEGYLINTAEECVSYVKAVDRANVKVMLDTFHMNIEEDSLTQAILSAGDMLGHLHVGESNRKPPYAGGRMPWPEIAAAVKKIGYDKDIVLEPFVQMGGQVGKDIAIWRDISGGASEQELDRAAAESATFLKKIFS